MGLVLKDCCSKEAEVPVKRMPPVNRMISRFTGRSAAKTKSWIAISGIGKPACDPHGEHATEAGVAFRAEGLVEGSDERLRGQLHGLVHEGLVPRPWQ